MCVSKWCERNDPLGGSNTRRLETDTAIVCCWWDMENSKAVLIAIGASVILLSSLNIFIRDCPIFVGLVPVNTMIANTYAWNVITSCFFETCIPKIAADLMLYYFVSKNLSIGNMEHFFLFMGLSILACTIGTSAFCFIRFFSTKLEEMLLTPVYGFSGVLLCISMFARQQKGNEAIVVNIPFFTFQNFPVAFISIQFVFSLLGVHQMALDLPFTVISLLFSWSYLRFFHRYDDDSIGDKSDDFAFVAMFPPVR